MLSNQERRELHTKIKENFLGKTNSYFESLYKGFREIKNKENEKEKEKETPGSGS